MRSRRSRIPSLKPKQPACIFWLLPARPISEPRPSCSSPAATLLRSTRLPPNRTEVKQNTVLRFFAMSVVVLLVALAPAWSQSVSSAASDEPDRSIKLLREDEDWSFLADPA